MKTPNPLCLILGRKQFCLRFSCTFLLLFFSFIAFSQTLAFPEAEGFGKYAQGGRGGAVYKVTNLNDSGSGSLRAACQASGPRTVVFEVSGTITLNSDLIINNGNLTIAGQTAPGDGICIKGASFRPRASNIIVRYIRFRLGDNGYKDANGNIVGSNGADSDTVGLSGSSGLIQDIIFDHCSMSWSIDELIGIYGGTSSGSGVSDITFQYCIFSEGLWQSHHSDGSHSMAFLMNENSQNISIYKNLFAHSRERHIRAGGGCSFEMINNVIYNFRYSCVVSASNEFTMINNHYKAGSQSISSSYVADFTSQSGYNASDTKAYISGNTNDAGMSQIDSGFNPYLLSSPLIDSGIDPDSVGDAIADVLSNSGATLPVRDAVDQRIINEYNTTTGSIIDTPAEVGGYPILNSQTAPSDLDDDGMPDSWEIANGLNPNDASDRNVLQPDGYTNLEYYLNGMTLDVAGSQVDAGNDVDVCLGETVTLAATGADSYVWTPGNLVTASIEVSPDADTTYTVTGTHSDGSTSTDSVIVSVTETIADAGADVEICQGSSVTLSANGGTSYLWNTGETSQSIEVNPNATTTYSVVVTENGCESEPDDVVVTVNPSPNVDAGLDVTINYGESIELTATGADSYVWSTGETSSTITVSPTTETTYSVTGTTGPCESEDSITVFIIGNEVVANAGEDQTICNGSSITLTATGGAAYVWNNGETTASIEVSPNTTTTYTVTVFDETGIVSDTDDVVVTVNDLPNADAGADVDICEGETVTLTASGGSSYLWNTGETTANIEVSPNTTTTYAVEVSNNGCSSTDEVTVTVNALPNVDAGSDVAILENETVTLTATGATSYQWSTGETTASIEVNPSATTTYTVTGFSNGCESTDEVVVTVETENVTANAGADVEICEGETVTLTASGGTSYQWNTGETTAIIEVSPSTTTTYSVTVFNTLGTASDTDDVTVTVNALPNADAGSDIEICEGETVTLTASGGTSYLWNTGETTANIEVSPNTTTTYAVEVSNNGCSSTDEVTVTVNALPNVDAGPDVTITEGESIELSAIGADAYEWSTGEGSEVITVSPNVTTTYTVIGFSNGCQATDDVTVIVEPIVFEASAGDNQFICQGSETTLTASEGDSYLWSTGETTQSINVSPWSTETYSVTVFQDNQQATAEVTVFVNLNPNVVIMNGGEVSILEGEFITLSASGANTYEWSNGATQPNIAVSPTNSTTYSVTGFINNCSDTKSVTVNVVETVQADAGDDVFICQDETVTLTASGGDEYLWSTGETTPSIEVSPTEDTEYSVLVYNALDADEATVMVFVNDCAPEENSPEVDQEFDVLVYQDANADAVKIQMSGLQNITVDQVMIYDLTGKIIYSEQIKLLDGQQSFDKDISTSRFSRGIYVIRLKYGISEFLKKILIR